MKELFENRTKTSKLFWDGNIDFRIASGGSINHIKKNNQWLDPDTRLDDNCRVKLATYSAELIPGKIGYRGVDIEGREIGLEIINQKYVEPEVHNYGVSEDGLEHGHCSVMYKNVAEDYDIEFVFKRNGIKCFQHLKSSKAPTVCKFKMIKDPISRKKFVTKGIDKGNRDTKINVHRERISDFEEIMTLEFESEVAIRNPSTRKKTWSTGVEYPVVIDPTLYDDVNSVDDGVINSAGPSYNAVYLPAGPTSGFIQYGSPSTYTNRVWGIFRGITIPQSSTINSATLRWYGYDIVGNSLDVFLNTETNIAASLTIPALQNLLQGTTGKNPNLVAGTGAGYWPIGTTSQDFSEISHNVQTIVQNLVNSKGLSNGTMLFQIGKGRPGGVTYQSFDCGVAFAESANVPRITIDYTSAGWTGIVSGVTNPAKVEEIDVANITSVSGVS